MCVCLCVYPLDGECGDACRVVQRKSVVRRGLQQTRLTTRHPPAQGPGRAPVQLIWGEGRVTLSGGVDKEKAGKAWGINFSGRKGRRGRGGG